MLWPCVAPRTCHGAGAWCHMTTVSGTLYGTGDSRVTSALAMSQCQKVSRRRRSVGENRTVCRRVLQDPQLRPAGEGPGIACRGPGGSSGPSPGRTRTSHSTAEGVLAPSPQARAAAPQLQPDLPQLSQVTDLCSPLSSALKGEASSVSIATTRSLSNFERVFLKRVTKILSLEG